MNSLNSISLALSRFRQQRYSARAWASRFDIFAIDLDELNVEYNMIQDVQSFKPYEISRPQVCNKDACGAKF